MNFYDIYNKVVFSKDFEDLASKDVFYSEYDLEAQSNYENLVADDIVNSLNLSLNDEYLCHLLIKLDHIGYVPFGKKGATALETLLEKEHNHSTFSKFKFSAFETALKNNGVEISNELSGILNKFVTNYFNDNLDLNDPVNVAILIRRISSELENGLADKLITSPIQKNQLLSEIIKDIVSKTSQRTKSVDLRSYLPQDLENNLKEKDLKYLAEITNLISPEKKFE